MSGGGRIIKQKNVKIQRKGGKLKVSRQIHMKKLKAAKKRKR